MGSPLANRGGRCPTLGEPRPGTAVIATVALALALLTDPVPADGVRLAPDPSPAASVPAGAPLPPGCRRASPYPPRRGERPPASPPSPRRAGRSAGRRGRGHPPGGVRLRARQRLAGGPVLPPGGPNGPRPRSGAVLRLPVGRRAQPPGSLGGRLHRRDRRRARRLPGRPGRPGAAHLPGGVQQGRHGDRRTGRPLGPPGSGGGPWGDRRRPSRPADGHRRPRMVAEHRRCVRPHPRRRWRRPHPLRRAAAPTVAATSERQREWRWW